MKIVLDQIYTYICLFSCRDLRLVFNALRLITTSSFSPLSTHSTAQSISLPSWNWKGSAFKFRRPRLFLFSFIDFACSRSNFNQSLILVQESFKVRLSRVSKILNKKIWAQGRARTNERNNHIWIWLPVFELAKANTNKGTTRTDKFRKIWIVMVSNETHLLIPAFISICSAVLGISLN